MQRVAVINVVGLTEALLGPATPRLSALRARGAGARIRPVFPAVTCPAQSTYLTGLPPSGHGIVGNGWYHRDLAEIQFWKQSNALVQGPKLWETLRQRHPGFTCAKLFWWHNMHSTADYSITPRPIYPADGRKVFDIYSWPYAIRPAITHELGPFPFPTFWGPAAGRHTAQGAPDAASRWIAEAARWIETRHQPGLNLVYLPHLDYNLQRLGPDHPAIAGDLRRVDAIAGDLIEFLQGRGVRVVVLSEYGITPVDTPVHLNRLFRERGWLTIKDELGLEMLDAGASRAFAVADHQVAHIYLNDRSLASAVRTLLEENAPGVEAVLDDPAQQAAGIRHPRAGDLIAVARRHAWFTYYYWLDDRKAPDFARCVDIHRKPGYDPAELFLQSPEALTRAKILGRLLQKKLGFRMLMDVIPLDATLVKGSHGRRPDQASDFPVLLADTPLPGLPAEIEATSVRGIIEGLVDQAG